MNVQKEQKCEERIEEHLRSRIDDISELLKGMANEDDDIREEAREDYYNYGLSFDYVAPNTFNDQEEPYFRYQISYGGPSDEFRFYCGPDYHCHRIEYAFLDWFDGATRILSDDDKDTVIQVFQDFDDMGMLQDLVEKASE